MAETTDLAIRAPMDLTSQVQELQKENYNILLPMTTFASQNELFVPRLDIVIPDIPAGDFYKQGSKKIGNNWVDLLAPSGQFLSKISSAANIQWHPDKSGHTVLERNRAVYKAVAALRQADGQWRTITNEYELDLEVVEEELRMEYKKKAKFEDFQKKMEKEGMELEDYVMRDLLHKRRHKLALAATGAMNRVIRNALTLRSTYPANIAKNPFAIARFDFQPDYNDPQVRRYASVAAINAGNDLYGQGTVEMPADVSQEEIQTASDFMDVGNAASGTNFEAGEVIDIEIVPPTEEEEPPETWIDCQGENCGGVLEPFTDAKKKEWTPEEWAGVTFKKTGRVLCVKCFLAWQKEEKARIEAEKKAEKEKNKGGRK